MQWGDIVLIRAVAAILGLGILFGCANSADFGTPSEVVHVKKHEALLRALPDQPALLEPLCDAGEGLACGKLGGFYASGASVAPSQTKAFSLFKRACEAGSMAGCHDLGRAYLLGLGVEKDPDKGRSLIGRACNAGLAEGCVNLGTLYARGNGLRKDKAKAQSLYGLACDAGLIDGCLYAGSVYQFMPTQENYEKWREEVAKSMNYLERACDGGRAKGCYQLAGYLSVQKRDDAARRFYERSCSEAVPKGCYLAGRAYDRDSGIERDPSKVIALFAKACEFGSEEGCVGLRAAREGIGIDSFGPDQVEQANTAKAACDSGSAADCTRLARMYLALGKPGVSQDIAVFLLDKACNAGDGRGCVELASAYRSGMAPDPFPERRAAGIINSACERGLDIACAIMN